MSFSVLLAALLTMQIPGGPAKPPFGSLEDAFGRASKQADLDGAGLVLSSLLVDEATYRAALSATSLSGERSAYILFQQRWGAHAKAAREDFKKWDRIRIASISTKPELIRPAIRADRYTAFLRSRETGGGSSINNFPFTAVSEPNYADDLIEYQIETMREESTHRAEALTYPFGGGKTVLVTAEDREVNLLNNWQMLCGVCDRLDLIDGATTENWRGRFAGLDAWFSKNRPFLTWNDRRSCVRIDENAKGGGWPTQRRFRVIPELMPPWLPDEQ